MSNKQSKQIAEKYPASAKRAIRTPSSDGLVNVVSGLGTQKAKRSFNQFKFSALSDFGSLDAAYQSNWLARQIVDVPAEDMTREWRDIKCEDAEAIRVEEDRLRLPVVMNEALCWGRLYGGAGILMITGQDLAKPLNLSKIKKGGLQRMIVFDRFDMTALTLNTWNVLAENYLQPEFYSIRGGSQQIHWSHFAKVMGARLPRRQMMQTQGWGDSELRKCLDDIMDIVASKDGIAELMQEANIDVITREGLTDELSTDQDAKIIKRYEMFSLMKSSINMALLDSEEKLDRLTLNLSGVAPVIETFMTWISGAADIPVTRLFGTSAKGLNATGDGDMKNYYNSIRSKQNTTLDPAIHPIDEVLVRSALGYMPDDYNYEWNPLAQLNDKEIAEAAKLRADTDIAYLDANVIQVSQVQRNLQSSEQYQFDDAKIAELEKLEEPNLFDETPVDEDSATQTSDAQHWITTENGEHLLLNGEGVVIGGAGGKLNGTKLNPKSKSKDVEKIQEVSSKEKNSSQPLASTSNKPSYTPEYRASQKAAAEQVKSLPNYVFEQVGKEKGISPEEVKKELMLQANQDPVGNEARIANLKEVYKETEMKSNTQYPVAPKNKESTSKVFQGLSGEIGALNPSHHELKSKQEILLETEKAVAIENPNYDPQPSGYYGQHRAAKGEKFDNNKHIWLPRSQVSTSEGFVIGAAPWLAQKQGLMTNVAEERIEQAFSAGKEKYAALIAQAKAAGVPGIRNMMKTSTIKEKMRAHGITVDSAIEAGDDDDGLDWMNGIFSEF